MRGSSGDVTRLSQQLFVTRIDVVYEGELAVKLEMSTDHDAFGCSPKGAVMGFSCPRVPGVPGGIIDDAFLFGLCRTAH